MGMRTSVQLPTIAQSATVSADFALAGAEFVGIMAPVLTSCQAYLQVNYATTSAGFVRVAAIGAAADFVWLVGAGSSAMYSEALAPFAWGRIETDVAQAAAREFSVVTKF